MIRFLSIWKSGRQKTMLPAITNDRLIIPLPWRDGGNQRIFDGVVKREYYKMTFFKFRRKDKNEYLCSPNIQKNVFKNNSTQSRK